MTEAVIAVQSLEKSYGSVRAVAGISFEVEDGEIFGVVGVTAACRPPGRSARASQAYRGAGDA